MPRQLQQIFDGSWQISLGQVGAYASGSDGFESMKERSATQGMLEKEHLVVDQGKGVDIRFGIVFATIEVKLGGHVGG